MQTRSLLQMVLLTIITLGIYQIYWLYKTREEMVQKGLQIPNILILFAPYIALGGMFVLLFIQNFVFSSVDGGGAPTQLGLIVFLIGALGVLAMLPIFFYWFYKYCKAVESVTDGFFPFDMNYFMLVLMSIFGIAIIWPVIVQYYFNRVAAAGQQIT